MFLKSHPLRRPEIPHSSAFPLPNVEDSVLLLPFWLLPSSSLPSPLAAALLLRIRLFPASLFPEEPQHRPPLTSFPPLPPPSPSSRSPHRYRLVAPRRTPESNHCRCPPLSLRFPLPSLRLLSRLVGLRWFSLPPPPPSSPRFPPPSYVSTRNSRSGRQWGARGERWGPPTVRWEASRSGPPPRSRASGDCSFRCHDYRDRHGCSLVSSLRPPPQKSDGNPSGLHDSWAWMSMIHDRRVIPCVHYPYGTPSSPPPRSFALRRTVA